MKAIAKYLLVHTKNRTILRKDTAKDVAVHMLGRSFNDWAIYQLRENLPTDVFQTQKMLENNEKPQ